MSLVGKAFKFAAKIAVEAFIGEMANSAGSEVGTAFGSILARRIDTQHGKDDKEKDDTCET